MKIETVTVKKDFVMEVVKTLSHGMGINITPKTYIGGRTDVVVSVVEMKDQHLIPQWEVEEITAGEIYAYGTDSCYCKALEGCRERLLKRRKG